MTHEGFCIAVNVKKRQHYFRFNVTCNTRVIQHSSTKYTIWMYFKERKNVHSRGVDCFQYVFIDTDMLYKYTDYRSRIESINDKRGRNIKKPKHKQNFKVGQCQMSFTYGILMNRETECKNKITEKNKSFKKKKRKTTIYILTL